VIFLKLWFPGSLLPEIHLENGPISSFCPENECSAAGNIHIIIYSDNFRNSLKANGEARASTGQGLGYSIGHILRCHKMRMISSRSMMKAIIFICLPHWGHFNGSTS